MWVAVGLAVALALAVWRWQEHFYRGLWWRFGPTVVGVALRKYRWRWWYPLFVLFRCVWSLYGAARLLTAPWRTVPDFYIVGAQKAGTTSLCAQLEQHGQLSGPTFGPLVFAKETHYFDGAMGPANWSSPAYYAMYFPLRALKALWPAWLVFDATPEYMVLPYVPRLIRRLAPTAKLIFMLREPAKRAYSGWQHQRKFHESSGDTSASFEADVAPLLDESADLAALWERLDAQPADAPLPHALAYLLPHQAHVRRGIYADQLKRYLDLFPREQILICQAEEYFKNPEGVARRICSFLGVAWDPRAASAEAANVGTYHSKGERPSDDFMSRLRRFYAPHNRRLYALLGEDLGWPAS